MATSQFKAVLLAREQQRLQLAKALEELGRGQVRRYYYFKTFGIIIFVACTYFVTTSIKKALAPLLQFNTKEVISALARQMQKSQNTMLGAQQKKSPPPMPSGGMPPKLASNKKQFDQKKLPAYIGDDQKKKSPRSPAQKPYTPPSAKQMQDLEKMLSKKTAGPKKKGNYQLPNPKQMSQLPPPRQRLAENRYEPVGLQVPVHLQLNRKEFPDLNR